MVIDIIALIVIGVSALWGAKKGFIKSIFGLLSVVLAVFIAVFIGAEIGKLISTIPSVNSTLGGGLTETIYNSLAEKGDAFTTVPVGGYTEGIVLDALSSVGIPYIIGGLIANPVVTALSGVSGVSLATAVAPVISELAFSAIGFAVVFVLSWALLTVLFINIRKKIKEIVIFNALDILLGLVLGALRGAMHVCVVLAIVSSLNFIPGLSDLITNSTIVSWISDNNFVSALLSSGFNVTSIVNEAISKIGLLA